MGYLINNKKAYRWSISFFTGGLVGILITHKWYISAIIVGLASMVLDILIDQFVRE